MEIDVKNLNKRLEDSVERRIKSRANLLFLKLCLGGISEKIWIAGNSLNSGECHDIDVFFPKRGYPIGGFSESDIDLDGLDKAVSDFNRDFEKKMGKAEIVYDSKNAMSVNFDGVKYQFCKYQKDTCQDLVESFDYAHIQIGAVIDFEEDGERNPVLVTDVCYTEAYLESMLSQNTWYIKSDYPLGSIFRAEKYKRYGSISNGEYKKSTIRALTDLINRGYKDYEDFKDSIGAIDLLLYDKETSDDLWKYFTTCCDRGLVASVRNGTEKPLTLSQFQYLMMESENDRATLDDAEENTDVFKSSILRDLAAEVNSGSDESSPF